MVISEKEKTMDIYDYVQDLHQKGVRLKLIDDNIKIIAHKQSVSNYLINSIKSRKDELIDFLQSNLILTHTDTNASFDNIFLIHSGNVLASDYYHLSNELMKFGFNAYCIRAKTSIKLSPQNVEIDDITEEYINQIKKRQAKGPYIIGGFSLGGTFAYDVVSKLEEQGDKVLKLLIIDSSAPNKISIPMTFNISTEMTFVKKYLHSVELNIEPRWMDLDIEEFWKKVIDLISEREDKLFFNNKVPDYLKSIIPDFQELTDEELFKRINLIRTLQNIASSYIPKQKINASTLVFVGSSSFEEVYCKWDEYTKMKAENIFLDVEHYLFLQQKNANQIAFVLKEKIRNKNLQ